jgi:hypothetical protein
MIQRVVRNGRVRAFGAEWDLSAQARRNAFHGDTVRVHKDGDGVLLYMWNEEGAGLVSIGRATRRPVIDVMALLGNGMRK